MSTDTDQTLFVTGVTGFLGRHFLYWQERKPLRFVVLVRAADQQSGNIRFLESMKIACDAYRVPFDEAKWLARTTVLLGDICAPHCGISAESLSWLRSQKISQFWHFAASLNYEEKSRQKIWEQNVQGTSNVINLLKETGITNLIYCSTAYTVGKAVGMVEEKLHSLPRTFNNYYEESKCSAEHQVANMCRDMQLKWTIIRPSIVIGPIATKNSGGSTSGMYGFFRSIFRLKKTLRLVENPITIIGNSNTRLNVIPVDNLMRDIADIPETGFENESILHLTSSWYPDVNNALKHTSRLMDIGVLKIVEANDAVRSPVEKVIDKRTEFHASYIDSEIEFARSLPLRHGVDNKEFAGFITEAYREYKQESPQEVFAVATIRSFDDTHLKVYSAGDPGKPVVVLANAIGMPVEFWTAFAKTLTQDYFVLTWETRGCPNTELLCNLTEHLFEHHSLDFVAVLDHFACPQAHVVGWCSGAQIALKAASAFPARVKTVACINGSFGGDNGVQMTNFEIKLREVMAKISVDARMAEIYFNVVYGNKEGSGVDAEDLYEKNNQASAVLTSVDPALLHLTSRPFETVESLFRYSRLISASLNESIHDWIDHVKAPVLVYSGQRDETAHPDCSRWIAGRLAQSALVIDNEGDHFTFYNESSVASTVNKFLAEAA